jgi:hypothetical protein
MIAPFLFKNNGLPRFNGTDYLDIAVRGSMDDNQFTRIRVDPGQRGYVYLVRDQNCWAVKVLFTKPFQQHPGLWFSTLIVLKKGIQNGQFFDWSKRKQFGCFHTSAPLT